MLLIRRVGRPLEVLQKMLLALSGTDALLAERTPVPGQDLLHPTGDLHAAAGVRDVVHVLLNKSVENGFKMATKKVRKVGCNLRKKIQNQDCPDF